MAQGQLVQGDQQAGQLDGPLAAGGDPPALVEDVAEDVLIDADIVVDHPVQLLLERHVAAERTTIIEAMAQPDVVHARRLVAVTEHVVDLQALPGVGTENTRDPVFLTGVVHLELLERPTTAV